MQKLTAIIPTLNEEANIADAIKSCLFADEVIVIDSYSTDKTEEIATSFEDVKFLKRKFDTHARQKNWAIDQAQYDWIFILDADERTSPQLIDEIKSTLAQENQHSAFWIKRKNIFMGKELRHIWKGDKVIRLFDRRKSRYEELNVHEEVVSKGEVEILKNELTHDTYSAKGWNFHIKKGHSYTTLSALDKIEKTGRVSSYHLFIKPLFTFLKHYILKRGFLDGKVGYFISIHAAWNVFERYVKIWRMRKGEKF